MIKELARRLWPAKVQNAPLSGVTDPQDWFVAALRAVDSDTGIDVDGFTCLRSGPLWQGVNVIAGDIGRLPLRVETEEGEPARRHVAWGLLNRSPNSVQLPITFKETLQSWALIWGNGCAWIRRNQRGEPIELAPMRPDRVMPIETEMGIIIEYSFLDGTKKPIPYSDVLHICGLGDAFWGYAIWDLGKNTIGHNLALQKHGNRQFLNSARPSGVLEKDGRMTNEGRANLRREWNDIHQGLDNVAKIALLQEGVKFKPTQITNEDAQWIEARRFSREEVAAWLNLPPHKLGAMENASVRSNLEEQNRDYWNSSLSRWAVKWEQECEKKLFSSIQKANGSYQVRFDLGELIRADIGTRSEAYSQGRQWGWLSVNEIRKREGLPGIGPEGDVYLTPVNMTDDPGGFSGGTEDAESDPEPDRPDDTQEPSAAVRQRARALVASRVAELTQIEDVKARKEGGKATFVDAVPAYYREAVGFWLDRLGPIMGIVEVVGLGHDDWSKDVEAYLEASCGTLVGQLRERWSGEARMAKARQILESFTGRRAELVERLLEPNK